MKRVILLLIIVFMFAAVFAGCSANNQAPGQTLPTGQPYGSPGIQNDYYDGFDGGAGDYTVPYPSPTLTY